MFIGGIVFIKSIIIFILKAKSDQQLFLNVIKLLKGFLTRIIISFFKYTDKNMNIGFIYSNIAIYVRDAK